MSISMMRGGGQEQWVARSSLDGMLASARGYDDPSTRYPSREHRDGVEVTAWGIAADINFGNPTDGGAVTFELVRDLVDERHVCPVVVARGDDVAPDDEKIVPRNRDADDR